MNCSYWKIIWEQLLKVTGDDPHNLYVYGSLGTLLTVYWTVGLLYTLLDIFNKPSAVRRYKIQPGANEPVNTWKLFKVIIVVLFNQTIVSFIPILSLFYLMQWRGIPPIHELPFMSTVLWQLLGCALIEEAGLYYTHRIFHHPMLYKHIHKLHHSWTAPIAVEALYAHPIEYIVSDLGPPMLGIFLFNLHISTALLWYTITVLFALNGHCGYHLPFLNFAEAHDYHHLQFNNCFGTLGILDWLHGTDKGFRASKVHRRNRILTSLKSTNELYPDDHKTD